MITEDDQQKDTSDKVTIRAPELSRMSSVVEEGLPTDAEDTEEETSSASDIPDAADAAATNVKTDGGVAANIGRFFSSFSFSCTSARSAEDAIDPKDHPTELVVPPAKEGTEGGGKLTAEEADAEAANNNAASKTGSGGSSVTGRILSFLHIGQSSTDAVAVGAPPIARGDIDLHISQITIEQEGPNAGHAVASNSTDAVSSVIIGKASNLEEDGDHSI